MKDELVKLDSNNTSMVDSVATPSKIEEYFVTCENAYRDFWDLDHSGLMSLGFWKKGTKNLREALAYQNEVMADKAQIKADDQVLDAGCGMGGSAVFLAKRIGCRINGITLVEDQVAKATAYASRNAVNQLVSFQRQDYTKTDFPDASFDVIWGIESICYAEPKSAFIDEAFRLLRPGGRLIVSEILATKEKMTPSEESDLLDNGYKLCMVNWLDTADQYRANLKTTGFDQIAIDDMTELIRPSINRLYLGYYPATVYNRVKNLFGRDFSQVQLGNTKMLYYLHKSLKRKLWEYGLIYAQKPKTH
ncbi:MAG: methyltransferase domain-containing protein [Cyclobacteriaceae bacterium]